MRRRSVILVTILSAVLVADSANGAPAVTERVSVNDQGQEGNSASLAPSVTANGLLVAFYSAASNLASGDGNGKSDVFVRDRILLATERVSVPNGGGGANDGSFDEAINGDGRFVAFQSLATNLVAGDSSDGSDIFVRDRVAAGTEKISVGLGGASPNSYSERPAISQDGRYVAFRSQASNLVAGDTNNELDIFVRDRSLATTEVSSAGGQTIFGGLSHSTAISADGR